MASPDRVGGVADRSRDAEAVLKKLGYSRVAPTRRDPSPDAVFWVQESGVPRRTFPVFIPPAGRRPLEERIDRWVAGARGDRSGHYRAIFVVPNDDEADEAWARLGSTSGAVIDHEVSILVVPSGGKPSAPPHFHLRIAEPREVLRLAPGLKIAVVLGDDVFARLDEFLAKGYEMRDMDTGAPLAAIRARIQSANAYIGAFPLAEALATGADIVIAGRSTDTALTLAPMVHAFGWRPEDYDKLAAGTIAGHIIECGAQCTGGNCQVDWQSIPGMADIGYPIVEAEPDGSFIVTRHPAAGGRVSTHTVKEQLLYELGDPANYITPDCVADFTTIRLEDAGPDRVRASGIRGRPRTPFLKLSISYADGWKAIGTLVYSWPQALEKAKAADAVVRRRLAGDAVGVLRSLNGIVDALAPARPAGA
jgi:hypothetical protein